MIFRSRTKNTFFEVITVKIDELIMALQKLKVQTGSLACLGCKHEDTCGEHGCALIREAVTQLIEQNGWINKIFWGDNLQVMSLSLIHI